MKKLDVKKDYEYEKYKFILKVVNVITNHIDLPFSSCNMCKYINKCNGNYKCEEGIAKYIQEEIICDANDDK